MDNEPFLVTAIPELPLRGYLAQQEYALHRAGRVETGEVLLDFTGKRSDAYEKHSFHIVLKDGRCTDAFYIGAGPQGGLAVSDHEVTINPDARAAIDALVAALLKK